MQTQAPDPSSETALAQLRASEARLTLALEAAREGLYDYQPASSQLYLSPTTYTLLGYEPAEFPASLETLAGLAHPEDWPAARQLLEGDMAGGDEFCSAEFRLRAKMGEWRWLLGRGRVTARAPDGSPLRSVGTLRDISEQKQTEARLREREELYRVLFEENRAIKLLIDPDTGAIVEANDAACEFYGYPAEKLLAMRITDINILPPERVREEMQRAVA